MADKLARCKQCGRKQRIPSQHVPVPGIDPYGLDEARPLGRRNTIGDVWTPRERANDQTASAFRRVGLVMMFPSLRGGNENPGQKEAFLGEVDDVLAAADFLSRQDRLPLCARRQSSCQ